MTEKESSKFKIRPDDNPETHFQVDFQEQRFEKLNRRLILFAILIPLLIGITLFLGYRDIKTRVGIVSDTGTSKVQTLSKDLESRFQALKTQQDNLQAAHLQKTAAIEKQLEDATNAIKNIRTARKEDNRKTDEAIEAVNKILAPLPQKLDEMAANLKAADLKLSSDLQAASTAIQAIHNNLTKIQTSITALAANKIDQKTLDMALNSQQKAYQQDLKEAQQAFEKQISLLKSQIDRLTPSTTQPPAKAKPAAALKPAAPSASTDAPAAAAPKPPDTPAPPPAASATKPPTASSVTKPGTIIEQDIK